MRRGSTARARDRVARGFEGDGDGVLVDAGYGFLAAAALASPLRSDVHRADPVARHIGAVSDDTDHRFFYSPRSDSVHSSKLPMMKSASA